MIEQAFIETFNNVDRGLLQEPDIDVSLSPLSSVSRQTTRSLPYSSSLLVALRHIHAHNHSPCIADLQPALRSCVTTSCVSALYRVSTIFFLPSLTGIVSLQSSTSMHKILVMLEILEQF